MELFNSDARRLSAAILCPRQISSSAPAPPLLPLPEIVPFIFPPPLPSVDWQLLVTWWFVAWLPCKWTRMFLLFSLFCSVNKRSKNAKTFQFYRVFTITTIHFRWIDCRTKCTRNERLLHTLVNVHGYTAMFVLHTHTHVCEKLCTYFLCKQCTHVHRYIPIDRSCFRGCYCYFVGLCSLEAESTTSMHWCWAELMLVNFPNNRYRSRYVGTSLNRLQWNRHENGKQ